LFSISEILALKAFDSKADVYSYGLLLWELWALKPPFDNSPTNLQDIVNGIILKQERPVTYSAICHSHTPK